MSNECKNPLLLQWLKEWMDQAQERNSKGYTVYKKAYQSMKACPLTFDHPSEAQQLNGLGPKLCDRLADKLKDHCAENGLPMPQKGRKKTKRLSQAAEEVSEPEPEQPPKKARKVQPYVPKLRSGPYALIMALSTLDQEGNQALSKNDLIERAQPLCDSSFTTPSDPTKFFTAWNSMKTLESKEMVCTKGHPTKRYYLSDDGWEVALRMNATEGRVVSTGRKKSKKDETTIVVPAPVEAAGLNSKISVSRNTTADEIMELSSSPDPEPKLTRPSKSTVLEASHSVGPLRNKSDMISLNNTFMLEPGSFDLRLLIDTREIRSTTDRDYISSELRKLGIQPIIRSLPLGDVLWIAQLKEPHAQELVSKNVGDEDDGNTEIVLEHIMERKRLDDLIFSIKDGRFHEQKFRLRKSGMKYVTYLIEDYSISAERSDKYGEAMESAIAGMQMVSDIFVKQTSKLDETIRYLARMTKTLKELYEKKPVHVIPSSRLDASTYLSVLDKLRQDSPSSIFGTTFSAFGALCDKSDSMTLRDLFLKMLMCTRGVTGDKAIEIQKIWPTPRAFIEAFKTRNGTKAKESMVSDRLGEAIPRKKVAKALSAKIAEIWA